MTGCEDRQMPLRMLHKYFQGWNLPPPSVPESRDDLVSEQRVLLISCADMGMNDGIHAGGMKKTAENISNGPAVRNRNDEEEDADGSDDEGEQGAEHSNDDNPSKQKRCLDLQNLRVIGGIHMEEERTDNMLKPDAEMVPVDDAALRE